MSPDNVFAAQMWAWPDAVIKRNAHGQVMVVNAAFLSLYGGRVEDWQGNAVQGWSAPPRPGEAVRFETRVPAQEGSERVFDWIESALADGSSLAVARDVTAIRPGPGGTAEAAAPPAGAGTPPEMAPPAAEPVFETVMSGPASGAPAEAAQAPLAETAVAEAPVAETPVAAAPAIPDTPHVSPAIYLEAETAESEMDRAETDATQADEAAPRETASADVVEAATSGVSSSDAAPHTVSNAAAHGEDREYERRALPIDNESAVLGNNWRDAVIAKAVGASGPEADAMSAAPAAAESGGGTEGICILLAEDNAINALLTRTLLEAEGCIVDTVEDGIYAVEAMKTKAYDLIFMDMRMPQMDGLTATRKIRAMDHASNGLPIVALTANAFDDDRNACFDAGMNDFMTKPVSAEELSEMVAAWTGPGAEEKLKRAAM